MIYFKNVTKYEGMFKNCHMEPIRQGFSLFDKQGRFVGYIINEGFVINEDYEFSKEIMRVLTLKGIHVFGERAYTEIENQKELDEALDE